MPLSDTVVAPVSPAGTGLPEESGRAGARARLAEAGPDHHAHAHRAHDDHAEDLHTHAPPATGPALRIGPSVLRMSLTARLVLACSLLAILWTAVALVAGGEG